MTEYRDKFICYCMGGGGGPPPPPPPPAPPPTNVPTSPGSDAFQRFQEVRAGLPGSRVGGGTLTTGTDILGSTKGTQVT